MSVDWRGLFDSIRVPWKDRGKNTSRKNVNICCPFCRDDQGYHLGISEDKPAYYCFRQPEHASGNLIALLVKMGQPRTEAFRLLNEFSRLRLEPAEAPALPAGHASSAWERFASGEQSNRLLDYIEGRGFADPEQICRRYDIRQTSLGRWALRALLPMRLEGELKSWTGRALRAESIPKYLTHESGLEGLVYMPRPARDLTLLVEGPLDALKLAVAGESMPVSAIALTGKQLNGPRLWNIRQALTGCTRLGLALDAGVSRAVYSRMTSELRAGLPGIEVRAIFLPDDYKDAGEMPIADAQQWLAGLWR